MGAVAGDGAVGKTSLIINLVNSSWEKVMVQPAYESYDCFFNINNETVKTSIYDTVGQDDFSPTRDLIFSKVCTVLLCYSVISPSSFYNIPEKWIPEIKLNNANCKIILVATKADLRDDESVLARLTERGFSPITIKQGKALAKSIGSPFIEIDKTITADDFSQLFAHKKSKKGKKSKTCTIS